MQYEKVVFESIFINTLKKLLNMEKCKKGILVNKLKTLSVINRFQDRYIGGCNSSQVFSTVKSMLL